MLTLRVCRGPHKGTIFSLVPPPYVEGAVADAERLAVLGRHPPECSALRFPDAPFFSLPEDAKLSLQQGAFVLRTIGGAGSDCVVSEYRDLGSRSGSVVFPSYQEETTVGTADADNGWKLKGPADVRAVLQEGSVIIVGSTTLVVTSAPVFLEPRPSLPKPVTTTAAPPAAIEAAGDSAIGDAAAYPSIDPIILLILCAANGYAADLVKAGCLSRDPDLWSYLIKVPLGRRGKTWLHAAAWLGHADRVSFLLRLGALSRDQSLRARTTVCILAVFSGYVDALTLLADVLFNAEDGTSSWLEVVLARVLGAYFRPPTRSDFERVIIRRKLLAAADLLFSHDGCVNGGSETRLVEGRGRSGVSLLHTAIGAAVAAKPGAIEWIRLLLRHGASVDGGILHSVLDESQFYTHSYNEARCAELCELMLDYGACPNALDKQGRTPLASVELWTLRCRYLRFGDVLRVIRKAGG